MVNIMMALLVQYTDLSAEDGKKIADELTRSIKPARYEDAERLIARILDDIKK